MKMETNKYIFSKQDLPTWSELYHDFYERMFQRGDHVYTPGKDTELEMFWRIPKKKYVIATTCNQFNKILVESSSKKQGILRIINELFCSRYRQKIVAFDVRFSGRTIPDIGKDDQILGEAEWESLEDKKFKNPELVSMIAGTPVQIYTLTDPDGSEDPFRTDHPRININDVDSEMCVFAMVKFARDSATGKHAYFMGEILPFDYSDIDCYNAIIREMLKEVIDYFEGGFVGWKDNKGNPANADLSNVRPVHIGYDPAK